jgi:putative salt-induced outer membrane protein YdiY
MRINTIAAIFLISVFVSTAVAETIHLSNGDRISGQILGVEDGRMRIRTAYAGEITIAVADVAAIEDPVLIGELVEVLDAAEEKSDEGGWKNRFELGAVYNSGNSTARSANTLIQTQREWESHRFLGNFRVNYGEDRGERTQNEQILFLRDELKNMEPWYIFNQLTLERDEFEDLDLRAIYSPGVGYNFIDREEDGKPVLLQGEVGPAVVYRNYRERGGSEWAFEAYIGGYYERPVFDEARFYVRTQYYPSITDAGEFRLNVEVGLEQPLSETMNLKLTFIDQYNSDVTRGVKRNDFKALLSITWDF